MLQDLKCLTIDAKTAQLLLSDLAIQPTVNELIAFNYFYQP